jgi:catechol 2,3-dioxygenase-like lactoylglutathione lyase family enzyme
MLSHVYIGVTDFELAFAFYSRLMELIGSPLKFKEPDKAFAGWKPASAARPLFLIGHPYNGARATVGNGQMTALLAPNRDAVDKCYAAALANGGKSEGSPGLRPKYHADYYGAYFRDPDGNKLCVCCHDPAPLGAGSAN